MGDVPPITYANVYERICHNDLKPVLAELEREYGDEVPPLHDVGSRPTPHTSHPISPSAGVGPRRRPL